MKIYNLYLNEIDFNKKPSEISKHKSQVNFILNLSLAELLSLDKTKINQILSLGYQPQSFSVVINDEVKTFTKDEWIIISKKSEMIQNYGLSFGVKDKSKIWTIDEVANANAKVETSSNEIKKLKLSPLEKILATYLKVSSRKYVSEELDENGADSRSLYGVLNSDKIVCVGFTEWMKSILQNLNDPSIKAYTNAVQITEDNQTSKGFHQNLIMYVKDEKYNLDGYYYFDPTWDSVNEFTNLPTLNYFLIPIEDIKNIWTNIIDVYHILDEPDEPEEKKTKTKSKDKQVEIIDAKQTQKPYVYFSGEKIKFSREFLIDYLNIHPDKCEIYADLIFGQDISILEEKLLDNEIKKEHYEIITKSLAKYDLPIISNDYVSEFKKIFNEALDSGNVEKLDALCEKIISSLPTEEKVIQSIKHNVKLVYEYMIYVAQNDIDSKKEELREFEKDDSYTIFLAEYIKNLEEKIVELKKECALKFEIIDKTFENDKDLRKNITYLSSETIKSISNCLTPYADEQINNEDLFVKYLNSNLKSSFHMNLNGNANYVQEQITEISEAIEDVKYKQSDISVIATNIMSNEEISSLIIEDIQSESKVVDMSCFYKLLINTISKLKPNLSKDKIDKMVDDIIDNSVKRSEYNYKPTSINPFVQEYFSKNQEYH